jgi:PST family polysaccharide transporter
MMTLAIGVVRTKALAVLLGPAGFGLLGVYGSVADLARAVVGMGINNSGVRQIAEAASSGDSQRVAATRAALQQVANLLGLLAVVVLVAFCRSISQLSFGTTEHAVPIALLSIAVWLRLVGDGQTALLQGMRRVGDMAKSGVLAALLGTFVGVPIVYVFGTDGAVPSLITGAAAVALAARWYARKSPVRRLRIAFPRFRQEATLLLKLGLAFMASGLFVMAVAYLVRIIIVSEGTLDDAGLYQAAWVVGGLYVGFVLQAMGADFYPRLVGAADDDERCNRLVNEQACVSLLLSGPGVIATLTFAPLVVALFYSADFAAAVDVLRWICLGMALRVFTWPIGFVIVARNRQLVFFFTELAWATASVLLAWAFVREFGLDGAGIAYFASYAFHACVIYPIVHSLSGFHLSASNGRTALLFVVLIAVTFCGFHALRPVAATALGSLALVISVTYSLRALATLLPIDRVPAAMRPIFALLHRRQPRSH